MVSISHDFCTALALLGSRRTCEATQHLLTSLDLLITVSSSCEGKENEPNGVGRLKVTKRGEIFQDEENRKAPRPILQESKMACILNLNLLR